MIAFLLDRDHACGLVEIRAREGGTGLSAVPQSLRNTTTIMETYGKGPYMALYQCLGHDLREVLLGIKR